MSNTVIKVENISKMYDLGLVGTGTLSKDLNRIWARWTGKPDPYAKIAELNDRTKKSESGSVWVLKDINFDVQQGEVLGIIGKNGAGKSTLLKILSKITAPTSGEVKIKGRVASLLEVGTGMHPEMTARQNIYLNGSIMGMSRQEINSKLEEIIDFAGVERYVDTPTKRFKPGMQVRLGFAVAAFLEPEILIVDEVLAVGDAEFQKKAISKMQDVSKGAGRTVLFVSHNMASLKSLCTKGILLANGTVRSTGNINDIVEQYLSGTEDFNVNKPISANAERRGNGNLRFEKIILKNQTGNEIDFVSTGDTFTIELCFSTKVNEPFKALHFSVNIKDREDKSIAHMSNSVSNGIEFNNITYPHKGKVCCKITDFNLQPGSYNLEIYCASYREPYDWVFNAGRLIVDNGRFYPTNLSPPHGVCLIKNDWTIELN